MTFLTPVLEEGVFTTVQVGNLAVPTINQQKREECGGCCVGLVLRMTGSANANAISPQMLRTESQNHKAYYRPHPAEVIVGPRPDGLGDVMRAIRSLNTQGRTYFGLSSANIVRMLERAYGQLHAKFRRTKDSLAILTVLEATSVERPLIVAVDWDTERRHFVVACGYRFITCDEVLFSDPIFGAGWLKVKLRQAIIGRGITLQYKPAPDTRGQIGGDCITF